MLAGTSRSLLFTLGRRVPSTGFPALCSCFTLLCLRVGRRAARQSSGTFWRQTISHMLLGACWCVAVSVPPHGAAMARCSACAAFVGAAAAGAAKRVQEGRVPPAVLVRTLVSGCAERAWCSCGQVANRSPLGSLAPLKPLSPDLDTWNLCKIRDLISESLACTHGPCPLPPS